MHRGHISTAYKALEVPPYMKRVWKAPLFVALKLIIARVFTFLRFLVEQIVIFADEEPLQPPVSQGNTCVVFIAFIRVSKTSRVGAWWETCII